MISQRIRCAVLYAAPAATAAATPAAARADHGTSAVDYAALAGTALAGARITLAEPVAAGRFVPPPSSVAPDLPQRVASMPAFCRVRATAMPSRDSHVGIELWMPLAGWNGRLLGTGNGGGAGRIAYEMGMIEGLKRGFAVANTGVGTAPAVDPLAARPDRWVDFGSRATHEMTRIAKTMVGAFYKVASFRSYFEGCSTGGQQALEAAHRYPQDYDGILAGAPGNNRTHVASYFLWNYQALNAPAANLSAVRRLYAGPTNQRTGERIFAGLTPGSETMPLGPMQQGDPVIFPPQQFYLFDWALGAGDFDPLGFDFSRDLARVDGRLAATLNANAAHLAPFRRRAAG